MKTSAKVKTADHIRGLAKRFHVSEGEGPNDRLAHHITRLAGDSVELDEVERLLVGLKRAGHLSQGEMARLQAQYLREAKL